MAQTKYEEFDTTPEIHYENGVAKKVVTFCVFNRSYLAKSEVVLKDDGTFT